MLLSLILPGLYWRCWLLDESDDTPVCLPPLRVSYNCGTALQKRILHIRPVDAYPSTSGRGTMMRPDTQGPALTEMRKI